MKGWIKSIRASKGIIFLATTDGKSDIQLTLKEGDYILIGEIKTGASFIASGKDSVTPKGLKEFLVSEITILGESDDTYPIQPKKHSFDFLRTIPDLRGRTKTFQAIWIIRHILSKEIHNFLDNDGFVQYWTPIITQADCEGAGETFDIKTDWLEEKLTVSGQLHGEVGMMSLGKIYTFGPCFRAEKSATKKHLAEFWMLEPELYFYDLEQTIKLSEDLLKYVLSIVTIHKSEFDKIGIDIQHILDILDKKWILLKYEDICKDFELEWGQDISSDIEKKIIDKYKVPVFITHWAKELKPFYMKKDDKVAYCFDLIFPEVGELIGGSEREDSYEILKSEMIKSSLDLSKMEWYLNTRKYGSVPHSGFGLGFERLVMFVCKLQKIHDAIPFPISY